MLGERAFNLPVSSTKGATGHLMGAGGVTELIACIQAIHEGVIPATPNYEHPEPASGLTTGNIKQKGWENGYLHLRHSDV